MLPGLGHRHRHGPWPEFWNRSWWWGEESTEPRADLLRSLDADGPHGLVRSFASRATVNGEPRLTFYDGRQAIPDDPLALVSRRAVVR